MKVRATRVGYYGHERRYPNGSDHARAGESFELSDDRHFSIRWMERVDPLRASEVSAAAGVVTPNEKRGSGYSPKPGSAPVSASSVI